MFFNFKDENACEFCLIRKKCRQIFSLRRQKHPPILLQWRIQTYNRACWCGRNWSVGHEMFCGDRYGFWLLILISLDVSAQVKHPVWCCSEPCCRVRKDEIDACDMTDLRVMNQGRADQATINMHAGRIRIAWLIQRCPGCEGDSEQVMCGRFTVRIFHRSVAKLGNSPGYFLRFAPCAEKFCLANQLAQTCSEAPWRNQNTCYVLRSSSARVNNRRCSSIHLRTEQCLAELVKHTGERCETGCLHV